MQIFAGAVLFDVFAHLDDLARALVAENDGDEAERIVFEFVRVGAAYAAAFDFDEDIAVAHFGKRIFLEFKAAFFDQFGHARRLGNAVREPERATRRGSTRAARHAFQHFFDDFFNAFICP